MQRANEKKKKKSQNILLVAKKRILIHQRRLANPDINKKQIRNFFSVSLHKYTKIKENKQNAGEKP